MPRLAIVLFGAPGSGKGTQAALLAGCLGLPRISIGDRLREWVRSGAGGTDVAAAMQAGGLVSDEVVNRLVAEQFSRPEAAEGFVLDGYPRNRAQAEFLRRALEERGFGEVVIHLAVDYNRIIERLARRRQCARCGTVYNMVSRPPRTDEICDLDGEKLMIREDDREPVIRERLEAYEKQTRPLLDYFRENGWRLHEIGSRDESPEELARAICQLIKDE